MNNGGLIAGSVLMIIGYIVIRVYIELVIRYNYFSKNERKKYRKTVSLLNKFWLTWIENHSKVKYSKSERKYINYPLIISTYKMMNITMLIFLIGVELTVVMSFINIFQTRYAYVVLTGYSLCILLCFVILSFIEGYKRTEYHRKRRGW